MNRGFICYFKNGVKSSAKTIYKNKNIFVFYVYFFMRFLANLFILPGFLFGLSDVRQAKSSRRCGELEVLESFSSSGKGKSLGTYVLATVVEALIIIGGLLAIGLVGALLGFVGAMIAGAANGDMTLLSVIFSIPAWIVALAYMVLALIFFAPTAYIIDSNENVGLSEVLSICYDTMFRRGKLTCFLNVVIPHLINFVALGLCVGVGIVLVNISGIAAYISTLFWVLIVGGAFIVFAPLFELTARTSLVMLMEDIALDPTNAKKHTRGLTIKKTAVEKKELSDAENRLMVKMFEDEDYDTADTDLSNKRAKSARRAETDAARIEEEVMNFKVAPPPQKPQIVRETVNVQPQVAEPVSMVNNEQAIADNADNVAKSAAIAETDVNAEQVNSEAEGGITNEKNVSKETNHAEGANSAESVVSETAVADKTEETATGENVSPEEQPITGQAETEPEPQQTDVQSAEPVQSEPSAEQNEPIQSASAAEQSAPKPQSESTQTAESVVEPVKKAEEPVSEPTEEQPVESLLDALFKQKTTSMDNMSVNKKNENNEETGGEL